MKILIILSLITSCTKKSYTQKDCESLSMKTYKGGPIHAKKLQKFCHKYSLKYNKETCTKALADLIMGAKEAPLKKKYGHRVMECFTQNDLEKFNSDYRK